MMGLGLIVSLIVMYAVDVEVRFRGLLILLYRLLTRGLPGTATS